MSDQHDEGAEGDRWLTAEMDCAVCSHHWVAVYPEVAPRLECPVVWVHESAHRRTRQGHHMNYCTKCQSYYQTPGTCNCFAPVGMWTIPARPVPVYDPCAECIRNGGVCGNTACPKALKITYGTGTVS